MKLSIRSRILLSSALPIVLFAAFTVWLGLELGKVKQSLSDVSEQSIHYALRAADLDKNVVQIQQFFSDIAATRGKDGLDDGFTKAEHSGTLAMPPRSSKWRHSTKKLRTITTRARLWPRSTLTAGQKQATS